MISLISFQYFGGTNFGRTAGGPLVATSYDYDAPIDEYGKLSSSWLENALVLLLIGIAFHLLMQVFLDSQNGVIFVICTRQ